MMSTVLRCWWQKNYFDDLFRDVDADGENRSPNILNWLPIQSVFRICHQHDRGHHDILDDILYHCGFI